MLSNRSANDTILQPFLTAEDFVESQAQLMILLTRYAEPHMRSVIVSRLGINHRQQHPDYEDLFSEVKIRLVTYLEELKVDLTASPCRDFRGYVAAIAHTACHDYFRQKYPARARLRKKIRDTIRASPKFALWKCEDQGVGDWLCGFDCWRGQPSSHDIAAWIGYLDGDSSTMADLLGSGTDIQLMAIDDLLESVLGQVGGPIRLADLVDLIANIKGIRDLPLISFDTDEIVTGLDVRDAAPRIDSVLVMRAPLSRIWRGLCQLPSDELKAYLLYARDTSGEDLITLFLAARIVTEAQVAEVLGMSLEEFRSLWLNSLPLDNDTISRALGVKIERVYKLRCQAGKRLKGFLSEIAQEK
jgi:hypothetical protein